MPSRHKVGPVSAARCPQSKTGLPKVRLFRRVSGASHLWHPYGMCRCRVVSASKLELWSSLCRLLGASRAPVPRGAALWQLPLPPMTVVGVHSEPTRSRAACRSHGGRVARTLQRGGERTPHGTADEIACCARAVRCGATCSCRRSVVALHGGRRRSVDWENGDWRMIALRPCTWSPNSFRTLAALSSSVSTAIRTFLAHSSWVRVANSFGHANLSSTFAGMRPS